MLIGIFTFAKDNLASSRKSIGTAVVLKTKKKTKGKHLSMFVAVLFLQESLIIIIFR